MKKQVLIALPLLVLCLLGHVFAEVRQETGSFVIAYTDIVYSGGLEPKIGRTYDSKSSFRGMFGLGWGSNYETYLTITGYGPIVLHDFERGEDYRFFPADWLISKPSEIADLLVVQAIKISDVKNPAEANNLKSRLLRDPSLMDQYWKTYAGQGLVTSRDLPVGSKMRGERFGYQEITRVRDGYEHRNGFGRVEKFNGDGKLIGIWDGNGNNIVLTLNANGRYDSMQDNFNRKMVFIYNNHNLVEKVTGTSPGSPDRIATYKYNERDEMVFSKDWNNIVYGHEYTAGRMSKISYPEDKTTREMTYYDPENGGNIKTIKDREGATSSYAYSIEKTDGNLIVHEDVRSATSKLTKNRYEYFYKDKQSGERWNWRRIATVSGAITKTDYEERCGCPTTIVTGQSIATFNYDDLGRVVRKTTATETTELTYLGNTARVHVAKRSPSRQSAKVTTATFRYDEVKGNLKSGVMSDGSSRKWFQLEYDERGRIKELRDSNNRYITFDYNNSSKPTHINVWDVGDIYVTYEADGETIKTFEAKDPNGKTGTREAATHVTIHVTAAFDLLDTITALGKVSFSSQGE